MDPDGGLADCVWFHDRSVFRPLQSNARCGSPKTPTPGKLCWPRAHRPGHRFAHPRVMATPDDAKAPPQRPVSAAFWFKKAPRVVTRLLGRGRLLHRGGDRFRRRSIEDDCLVTLTAFQRVGGSKLL